MSKTYEPIGWKNGKQGETPINATNLKHMDDAIKDLYDGGASTTDIVISPEEPTNEDWKIWIDTNEINNLGSEVVNSLDGNETNKAPSVNAINKLHTYSEEEIMIGTWIDGKPLYRKTINIGALPNKTDIEIPLPANCKRIIKFYGCSTDGSYGIELPAISLTAPIIIFISYPDSKAILRTHDDKSGYTESYLTFEYTKTTD